MYTYNVLLGFSCNYNTKYSATIFFFLLSLFLNSNFSYGIINNDEPQAIEIANKYNSINFDEIENNIINSEFHYLLNKLKELAPIVEINRDKAKSKSKLGVVTNVDLSTKSVIIQYINEGDQSVSSNRIPLDQIELENNPEASYSFIQNPNKKQIETVRRWKKLIRVNPKSEGTTIIKLIEDTNNKKENLHIEIEKLKAELTRLNRDYSAINIKKNKTLIKTALKEWKDFDSKVKALEEDTVSPPDFSQISKDECQDMAFNNIANFGPDTDQRYSGLCWAHTIAHLLREQANMVNPLKPDENVSVAEVASLNFKLGEQGAGDDAFYIHAALEAYLDSQFDQRNGGGKVIKKGVPPSVCLDNYGKNPHDEVGNSTFSTLQAFYNRYKGNSCNKDVIILDENTLNSLLDEQVFKFLLKDSHLWPISLHPSVLLTQEKLIELAKNARTANIFINQVMIYYCNNIPQARKPLAKKGEHVKYILLDYWNILKNINNSTYTQPYQYKKRNLTRHIEHFKSAKKAKHSLGLSICYTAIVDEIKRRKGKEVSAEEFNKRKDKCGGHAVVAAAVRWNDRKGCEIYVKNSHGRDANLKTGWYNANYILAHTFSTLHLLTQKK